MMINLPPLPDGCHYVIKPRHHAARRKFRRGFAAASISIVCGIVGATGIGLGILPSGGSPPVGIIGGGPAQILPVPNYAPWPYVSSGPVLPPQGSRSYPYPEAVARYPDFPGEHATKIPEPQGWICAAFSVAVCFLREIRARLSI